MASFQMMTTTAVRAVTTMLLTSLLMLSFLITPADGGPLAYAACQAACAVGSGVGAAAAGPAAVAAYAACQAGCAALLAVPTP